eukprot:13334196-Alexandrium_andersonii.AAC.1
MSGKKRPTAVCCGPSQDARRTRRTWCGPRPWRPSGLRECVALGLSCARAKLVHCARAAGSEQLSAGATW